MRALDSALFEPLIVIASDHHSSVIAEQLHQVGAQTSSIVLEPCARNTGAAAAVAALLGAQSSEDAMLLVMPADHRIADVEAFLAAMDLGLGPAADGSLVLFGVRPDRAATGYGYIHVGEAIPGHASVHRVAAFTEKPDAPTAEHYLEGGRHLWNSGIFLLSARSLLDELARHEPQILFHAKEALTRSIYKGGVIHLDPVAFARCPDLSLDYAVMERTDRAAVVQADFDWTDVGSWSTLWEIGEPDPAGNVLLGDVLAERTQRSYIRSEGPLVATVGVDDLIVVAMEDAVLVAHKSCDQEIKRIVERLRAEGRRQT